MNAGKKYVLCRALGGLNDQLVQIHQCYESCRKTGRTLVVDTVKGGLAREFASVFNVEENSEVEILSLDEALLDHLNSLDAYPKETEGHLSTYRTRVINLRNRSELVLDRSKDGLNLKDYEDRDATVLVHHGFGGGQNSLEILRVLSLKPDIADIVLERISQLPPNYSALHLRHTDIKVEAKAALCILKDQLRDKDLLLCTDDFSLRKLAIEELDPSTRLHFLSEIPQFYKVALHMDRHSSYSGSLRAVSDMFTDLLGLAFGKDLFFANIWIRHSQRQRGSGFVLLANLLRHERQVAFQLLSHGDRMLLAAMKDTAGDGRQVNDDHLNAFQKEYNEKTLPNLRTSILSRLNMRVPDKWYNFALYVLDARIRLGPVRFSLRSFLRRVTFGFLRF